MEIVTGAIKEINRVIWQRCNGGANFSWVFRKELSGGWEVIELRLE